MDENISYRDLLKFIIYNMWKYQTNDINDALKSFNVKNLNESANEVYCNTPIKEFRNDFEQFFKTVKTDVLNDEKNEQKAEELYNDFVSTVNWEKMAWKNIDNLMKNLWN